MNVKVVAIPNQVRSAYEDFLGAFEKAVEDNAGQVFSPDPPLHSCFVDAGEGTVQFKRCLYVKNLPCRRLSAEKRLDVVIMVLEELERGDPWRVKKSTVYVNYFTVKDIQGQLVQSMHFDFNEDVQTDHPVFHLHMSDEIISNADMRSAHFDLEIHPLHPSNECWVTTRIPTPDMTLTSVLYTLAADHLRTEIFAQFVKGVEPIQRRLPPLRFDAIKTSVQKSPQHFKSSHWFTRAG
jgi:hypothetical protein